jgi:hypothetical protein
MRTEKSANDSYVRFEHRHVDVGLKVLSPGDEQAGNAPEFTVVAHDGKRAESVYQRQRIA